MNIREFGLRAEIFLFVVEVRAVEDRGGSLIAAFKTRNEDALCGQSFGNFSLLNWFLPSLTELPKTSVALVTEGTEIRSSNLG